MFPNAAPPAQPNHLFGRERTLTVICNKLLHPDCRLLILLGPGGIGKTRLARAVIELANRESYSPMRLI